MDGQNTANNQPRTPVYTYEASINRRGNIVIPKELRQRMGIQAQNRIRFQRYADVIEIESAKPMTLEEPFGAIWKR